MTARATFPLTGLRAPSLGQRRTALVGEAAHVMPPIGAQGLNLGLMDIAVLVDILAEAGGRGADLGIQEVLDAYDRARRLDIRARQTAVDWLNRSLLSAQLPVQAVRGIGLHLLSAIPPLRQALLRRGLAPVTELPRLMQP